MAVEAPERNRNTMALAMLRIAVGSFFLIFAEYKVVGTEFTRAGGAFEYWIRDFLKQGAYPFMVPVLQGFVLSHARAIAYLSAYGELAIGLALVSGILLRLASFFGLVFMLTLLFSAGYPGPHAPFWKYFGASLDWSVFALCFAAFMIGRAAEIWSVPAWRKKRAPPAS